MHKRQSSRINIKPGVIYNSSFRNKKKQIQQKFANTPLNSKRQPLQLIKVLKNKDKKRKISICNHRGKEKYADRQNCKDIQQKSRSLSYFQIRQPVIVELPKLNIEYYRYKVKDNQSRKQKKISSQNIYRYKLKDNFNVQLHMNQDYYQLNIQNIKKQPKISAKKAQIFENRHNFENERYFQRKTCKKNYRNCSNSMTNMKHRSASASTSTKDLYNWVNQKEIYNTKQSTSNIQDQKNTIRFTNENQYNSKYLTQTKICEKTTSLHCINLQQEVVFLRNLALQLFLQKQDLRKNLKDKEQIIKNYQ